MTRDTLPDFFDERLSTDDEFFVHDDGYRVRHFRYRDVRRAAEHVAARLAAEGVTSGDKVIVWSENRPEWIIAFWGCLLAGVLVVPIDYRTSGAFLHQVAALVGAKLLLAGDEVTPDPSLDLPVWRWRNHS